MFSDFGITCPQGCYSSRILQSLLGSQTMTKNTLKNNSVHLTQSEDWQANLNAIRQIIFTHHRFSMHTLSALSSQDAYWFFNVWDAAARQLVYFHGFDPSVKHRQLSRNIKDYSCIVNVLKHLFLQWWEVFIFLRGSKCSCSCCCVEDKLSLNRKNSFLSSALQLPEPLSR